MTAHDCPKCHCHLKRIPWGTDKDGKPEDRFVCGNCGFEKWLPADTPEAEIDKKLKE